MISLPQRFAHWAARQVPPPPPPPPPPPKIDVNEYDVERAVRRDLELAHYRVKIKYGRVRFLDPVDPETVLWLIDNVPNLKYYTVRFPLHT